MPYTRRTAYSYAQSPEGVETVEAELIAGAGGRTAGAPGVARRGAPFPFPVDAVALDDQVAIDPQAVALALARAFLAAGGTLHTGMRVTQVHVVPRAVVETSAGFASADQVVLATATPITDRGLYFAKTRGLRSYCVAFARRRACPEGLYLSVDGADPVDPLGHPRRRPRSRLSLIVGGNGHPVGRADSERASCDDLIAWTRRHFPGAEPLTAWSAQDYQSHDLIPFVGAMPRGLGQRAVRHRLRQVGTLQRPGGGAAPRRPRSRKVPSTRPTGMDDDDRAPG